MSRPKAWLLSILVVSAALRIWMVSRGGQEYWPDESRYQTSVQAAWDLGHGRPGEAFRELFGHPEHVLFGIVGLAPAALQLLGMPARYAAAYFCLFSVGCIGLVAGISRVTSHDEGESVLAAGLAAATACLFYFGRHLVPYDAALLFALLGLYLGLRSPTPLGALHAGIWISVGFLTYNGYGILCGVCLALVALYRTRSAASFAGRCGCAATGFIIPVALVSLAERSVGVDFLRGLARFSGTVTQGDFGEGWTFAWSYLWLTEGGLLALWAACAVAACGLAAAGRSRHLLWWVGAVVFIYLALGEMSAGMHRMVIHGRIVRCLAPFLVLCAAGVLSEMGRTGRKGILALTCLVAAVALQAAVNVRPILEQCFPPEFRTAAFAISAQVPVQDRGRLRILNDYFIPLGGVSEMTARHHTLFSRPHPLQYRPYQFEGYGREQRTALDRCDISMSLVYLDDDDLHLRQMPDPVLGGYLGPVRITVNLPAQRSPLGEPLVVTGPPGAGDIVYVVCLPASREIQVGYDHWSRGGPVSAPIAADFSKPHVFEVCMGSLMPPEGSEAYRRHPEWERLREWLYVRVDGKAVLSQEAAFYPASPYQVTVAANLIGGSTTGASFSGVVSAIEPVNPASMSVSGRP